jgi:hypothetical protein
LSWRRHPAGLPKFWSREFGRLRIGKSARAKCHTATPCAVSNPKWCAPSSECAWCVECALHTRALFNCEFLIRTLFAWRTAAKMNKSRRVREREREREIEVRADLRSRRAIGRVRRRRANRLARLRLLQPERKSPARRAHTQQRLQSVRRWQPLRDDVMLYLIAAPEAEE